MGIHEGGNQDTAPMRMLHPETAPSMLAMTDQKMGGVMTEMKRKVWSPSAARRRSIAPSK